MNRNSVFEILQWTAVWASFHFISHYFINFLESKRKSNIYKHITRDVQDYLCGCIVSIVMSIMVVRRVLLIGQQMQVGLYIYELPMSYSSDESQSALLMLMGYFAYDLPLTLYWRKQWPGSFSMIIHHTVGLFSFGALIAYSSGHCCGLTAILMEVTNLFVNMRALLEKLGYKDSYPMLYLINGVGITISFFLARILYFSYSGYYVLILHWKEFSTSFNSFLQASIIIGYVVGLSLQYVWFIKIFQGMIKVAHRTFAQSATDIDKRMITKEVMMKDDSLKIQ